MEETVQQPPRRELVMPLPPLRKNENASAGPREETAAAGNPASRQGQKKADGRQADVAADDRGRCGWSAELSIYSGNRPPPASFPPVQLFSRQGASRPTAPASTRRSRGRSKETQFYGEVRIVRGGGAMATHAHAAKSTSDPSRAKEVNRHGHGPDRGKRTEGRRWRPPPAVGRARAHIRMVDDDRADRLGSRTRSISRWRAIGSPARLRAVPGRAAGRGPRAAARRPIALPRRHPGGRGD